MDAATAATNDAPDALESAWAETGPAHTEAWLRLLGWQDAIVEEVIDLLDLDERSHAALEENVK